MLFDLPLGRRHIVEVDAAHAPEPAGIAPDQIEDRGILNPPETLAGQAPGDDPDGDPRLVHFTDAGIDQFRKK